MGQFWLKSDTLLDDVQEQSQFQDHVCSLTSRCKLGKLTCILTKGGGRSRHEAAQTTLSALRLL